MEGLSKLQELSSFMCDVLEAVRFHLEDVDTDKDSL